MGSSGSSAGRRRRKLTRSVLAAIVAGAVGILDSDLLLQAQGTANRFVFQAEGSSQTAATYGDLKAVQTGGQMTRNLNNTLGNIDAVRAAANTRPEFADGRRIPRQCEESIGNQQKTITVNSILQQSLQDRNDAAYYNSAASNALFAGDIATAAGIVKGLNGLGGGGGGGG